MKNALVLSILVGVISIATPAFSDDPEHDHTHGPKRGPMGSSMMGKGMGMMGMMDGMGMCPMMGGSNTKVEVKDIKNGISIQITSPDKKEVDRIQKKGKIMELMRELKEAE